MAYTDNEKYANLYKVGEIDGALGAALGQLRAAAWIHASGQAATLFTGNLSPVSDALAAAKDSLDALIAQVIADVAD